MTENDVQAADAPQAATEDWRAPIEDARLREFAGRFATPVDAVKTAFELRQKLSTAFVPDGPEGYALAGPKGREASEADLAFRAEVAELFYGAQVTAPQAAALNRGWNAMMARAQAHQEASDARALTRAERDLRRDWGVDYDRNRAMAERAVARFHDGDPRDILNLQLSDGRLLGSLPDFVRYAAKVGEGLMEDTLHADTTTASGASIAERLDEIHAWQNAADPSLRAKYREASTQSELAALYRKLHGDGPVVGDEGRRT